MDSEIKNKQMTQAHGSIGDDFGVPMDSFRIVYDINGEFSCDIAHGYTEHWTQRHNPFLGKGLNGSEVLDFIDRVYGHRVLYAVSTARSPPVGVVFSLFNYPRGYSGEHSCVEKAFAALGRLLSQSGEEVTPCVISGADETFNIDGVTFATEFGKSAVDTSARAHYSAIYLSCAPSAFAEDGFLYTCCEMHRCMSYVASPTAASKSVVKEYWFYEPLTWLDAACGVHDDTFFFTTRGMRYKPMVPSELTDLETYGKSAAMFLPGSDAHLRFIVHLRCTSTSVLRRFFRIPMYSVAVVSELLIAWSERSKSAETVVEIVDFIKSLATVVPYGDLDAFLQAMYSRFAPEWLCTHVSLLYTTLLEQLLEHRARHFSNVKRVLRGRIPEGIQRIILAFCRPIDTVTGSAIDTSVSTVNDYMWAEPWWYKGVMSNVRSIFRNGENGAWSWSVRERFSAPLDNYVFTLEAKRWRAIISDSRVLESYDVTVDAFFMGGDPFEFIKNQAAFPTACCNPTGIIVLCALSLSPDPRVLGKWKHLGNKLAFISFMNTWTPLLQGYEYAANIFSRVISDDITEVTDCDSWSEHWKHVLESGVMDVQDQHQNAVLQNKKRKYLL